MMKRFRHLGSEKFNKYVKSNGGGMHPGKHLSPAAKKNEVDNDQSIRPVQAANATFIGVTAADLPA